MYGLFIGLHIFGAYFTLLIASAVSPTQSHFAIEHLSDQHGLVALWHAAASFGLGELPDAALGGRGVDR